MTPWYCPEAIAEREAVHAATGHDLSAWGEWLRTGIGPMPTEGADVFNPLLIARLDAMIADCEWNGAEVSR